MWRHSTPTPSPGGDRAVTPGNPEPGPRKKTPELPTHNWRGQVHPEEHDTALLEPTVYSVDEGGRGQHRRPPPLYTLGDPAKNTQKGVPTETRNPPHQGHPLPLGVEGSEPRIAPAQTKPIKKARRKYQNISAG